MAQQFSAAPKVVKPKPKYKQQPEQQQQDEIKLIYNNLMWDKRIFRGNTYSAIVISKKNQNGYEDRPKIPVKTIKQPQETSSNFQSNKRANIQIFTDQFVESLTDKPPRYEYASQTEPLPEKSVVRHRMNQKIGEDIETQIWDNELFDFDYEVEPLLNVLCGRTLEISRMEVLQEEELKIMSNRQQELRLYQREENKKIQGMYEDQDKLEQENLKNIQLFKKEKEKKVKTHKKVFARVIAKQFLRDIKNNTIAYVEGNGFFRNAIETRLITEVLPKFYAETAAISQEDTYYLAQANNLLQAAKESLIKEHAWSKQVQRTRRQQILDKRQERAREKAERKLMQAEQRSTLKFLAEQKIFLQQEQQRRREQQAKEQNVEAV